jgi:hypothetical protein
VDKILAEIIWEKVKGTKLPNTFDSNDYKWIIYKYWHRAMR